MRPNIVPNIVRTVCFTTLLMSLAAVASAQGRHHCSERLLEGDWGIPTPERCYIRPAPYRWERWEN